MKSNLVVGSSSPLKGAVEPRKELNEKIAIALFVLGIIGIVLYFVATHYYPPLTLNEELKVAIPVLFGSALFIIAGMTGIARLCLTR